MELIVLDDQAAVAEAGARLFARALAEEPALPAVLATGNSPIALYARLAELRARGDVDAGAMTAFQLDAYVGTPDDDPRSLWGWMRRAFVEPMGLREDQVRRLDADAPDPEAEGARFDAEVARLGGLGLAVLGLGPNGHLGFNEPPSAADAPTRALDLTPESVRSNAAYWGGPERVPRRAMTMGMASILAARRILLVVGGAHKHAVLRRAVEGPVKAGHQAGVAAQQGPATEVHHRTGRRQQHVTKKSHRLLSLGNL